MTCDAPLAWHQPDVDDPDRMLGVCPGCNAWHLLRIDFESRQAVFMQLPDDRQLFPTRPIEEAEASKPEPKVKSPPRAARPADRRAPVQVFYLALTK